MAVRLAVSMTLFQFSIGALNDLVDAPRDEGRRPAKPIPDGMVTEATAIAIVVAGAGLGLILAAPSGPVVVVVGMAGLAIGYAYDLRLKGTAWSWLPFAIGIPLIPVFAWLGVTGTLPARFLVLLPLTVAAGSALAIANARADMEVDRAAGTGSVAIGLGEERSWAVHAGLAAIVVVVALGWLVLDRGPVAAIAAGLIGAAIVMAGVILGRSVGRVHRTLAWELEAVGLAVLAAAWLAGSTPDQ
jgi:4-hydroxybenzoate polyprenyltransferase